MPTRPFLLTLLALLGCGSLAFAEEAAAGANDKPSRAAASGADSGAAKPMLIAARATPVPVATPIPEKRNLFNKLFGGGGPKKSTATPAPATPVKTARKSTPRPRKPADDGDKPDATETKAGTPDKTDKTDKPDKTEKPEVESKPPTTPKPRGGSKAAKGSDANTAKVGGGNSGNPEEDEKTRYEEVKNKAIADKSVQELREKADNALTEEDGRKALQAYNKALFKKMRALDASLEPRIDKMEAAILKQLDEKQ